MADGDRMEGPRPLELTNPLMELIQMCRLLTTGSRDAAPISAQLDKWEADEPEKKLEICLSIAERVRQAKAMIAELEIDADVTSRMFLELDGLLEMFDMGSRASIQNLTNWVGSDQSIALRSIAGNVPEKFKHPRIKMEDAREIRASIEELISWLKDHELEERDFVRQALIVGLERFHHRLQFAPLTGWSYSLEGLKDVIAAYTGLQELARGNEAATGNPIAEAIVMKTTGFLSSTFDMLHMAKIKTEAGIFGLLLLGFAWHDAEAAHGILAGLLK